MSNRLVRVNADIGGKKKGDEFKIMFVYDTPVDEFWRRRFKDAKIDNCVELVKEVKQVKKSKQESK